MRAEDIDLSSMLEFRPDLGQVQLNGQRMLIFSQQALGLLYESLATHLGHELTAAIFAQFGARSGREDFRAITAGAVWDTDLDRIYSGPVIHTWEGLVHVTPTALEFDRGRGLFFMAGEWRNSFEAANYVDRYGLSENPVCWALTGHATGWATEFFGADVLTIETSCVATGADLCRFEIRPIDSWDSRADPWRQAQRATPEFVTAYMEAKVAQRTAELTEANRRSASAQQAAEEALQANAELLARTSQELRTPLNGVIALAGRLRSTELSAEQRHLVDLIVEAGAQQLDVVSDVLDYLAPEPGETQLEPVPVNLPDLLDSVVRVASPMASAKGVTLQVLPAEADPSLSHVTTDALRLQQILNALISNAIKFTERGGTVDLAVTLRAEATAISVSDTGIGMSESTVSTLFEPFDQADRGTQRRPGGTGLGMVISRELAELIGARIEVSSRVGKGSSFTVLLPPEGAVQVQPTTLPSPLPGEAQGNSHASTHDSSTVASEPEPIAVLVADDNRINAVVITKLLESLGANVTTVADGQSAIAAFNSDVFDLVVLDLHMPNLDGVDVVRHIRIAEVEQGIPAHLVAALTADVLEETRKRCLAAGFSEFMTKPVRREEITALVARAGKLRSARRR
jgi:signal transduction histidine kinase/CheY-like chemotaxis protein